MITSFFYLLIHLNNVDFSVNFFSENLFLLKIEEPFSLDKKAGLI